MCKWKGDKVYVPGCRNTKVDRVDGRDMKETHTECPFCGQDIEWVGDSDE